ncbi:unnamed protein product [Parajaminaea phylloscopi]
MSETVQPFADVTNRAPASNMTTLDDKVAQEDASSPADDAAMDLADPHSVTAADTGKHTSSMETSSKGTDRDTQAPSPPAATQGTHISSAITHLDAEMPHDGAASSDEVLDQESLKPGSSSVTDSVSSEPAQSSDNGTKPSDDASIAVETVKQAHDASITPAEATRPAPLPVLDATALENAVRAVLVKEFGVSSIQQLASKDHDTDSILKGPLPQLVAEHMQKSAAMAAASVTNNVSAGEAGLGITFVDGQHGGPLSRPKAGPAPFPADALPSEIQLEQNTNLYLNGLGEHVTDDELLRIGSEYGEIISHKAIINSETGLCKGYGFIMYARARDAAIAIVELQKKGYQTSFARHESFSAKLRMMSDGRSSNVYISNLPLTMDEQQLETLVAPHQIISRRILTKPDGGSRGVGFIRFQNRDIAQGCIDLLHGKRLPGHPHPLQARFADSECQKRLKQDTTLRKIYADLDMGVLRSPSGHNLRPGLPSATLSSTSRTSASSVTNVHAASSAFATAMRPTNSEPGHRQNGMPGPIPSLRPKGTELSSIPMSATSSNGSFYPGTRAAEASPPTPLSPWFGTGALFATSERLEPPNFWGNTNGVSQGNGLGSMQPPIPGPFVAERPPSGWLLPPPPPRSAAPTAHSTSSLASTAPARTLAKAAAADLVALAARQPSLSSAQAASGLWSPAASTGARTGTPTMVSPSADSGDTSSRFNSPMQTTEGHTSLDGEINLLAGGKDAGHPAWMPRWTPTIAGLNLQDPRASHGLLKDNALNVTALEQKHLGSLLNLDSHEGSAAAEWAAAKRISMQPHVSVETGFNTISTSGSAVPIVDPSTGLPVTTHPATIAEDVEMTPTAALPRLVGPLASELSSRSILTPAQRLLRDTRVQSVTGGLADLASRPSVTSSVSAPGGYESLYQTSRHEGQDVNDVGPTPTGPQDLERAAGMAEQLGDAITLGGWP